MLFPQSQSFLEELLTDCFRMKAVAYSPLHPDDLSKSSMGWRLTTPEGVVVRFILPLDAPFGQPILFLETPDPMSVRWRNVELNGAMCLFPPGAARFPMLHPAAVLHVLDAMSEIIVTNLQGDTPSDVIVERQRWITQLSGCWSLIAPGNAPCQGVAVKVRGHWLLSESQTQCEAWLNHTSDHADHWVPVHAQWVSSFEDIPVSTSGLTDTERDTLAQGGLVLCFLQTETSPLGFAIAKTAQGKLKRLRVDRADRAWLHERGGSGLRQPVKDARVAIVGCGSLGAGVAELLVRAGIGSLSLIDHDHLAWDNIARHSLGGTDVGRPKAIALAEKLRRQIPTIEKVQAYPSIWQSVAADQPQALDCDLIVSTIATWPDELALADWARRQEVSLVLGWIEGQAIAGHAIALQGGCLGCLFDPSGRFRRAAALWTHKSPFKFADACHENYLPYGYADILPVQSLIATLATDVLMGAVEGDIHRCRLPHADVLEHAKVTGSADFAQLQLQGQLPNRWQELERDWPRDGACWYCSGRPG